MLWTFLKISCQHTYATIVWKLGIYYFFPFGKYIIRRVRSIDLETLLGLIANARETTSRASLSLAAAVYLNDHPAVSVFVSILCLRVRTLL